MSLLKLTGLGLVGVCLLLAPARPGRAQEPGPEGKIGILEALKHKDRAKRREAVEAIAEILPQLGPKAKELVNPLIDALADKDRVVRAGAARALSLIGPDAAV